ncbi:kinase-like protein [Serendipita vermifera]|nr:kinase-like protein [Serendipita vermifera]
MDDSSWDNAVRNLSGQLAPIDFREFWRGGHANVYQISWNGSLVAVKVICPVSPSLHSMRRKIRREGFIWSKLDHPNILPLLGFADDDKGFQHFGAFISPWCSQGNSEEYLFQRGDSMDLEERLGLLRVTVEGATYLHLLDPPIVHGDIKPANILIDQHGIPKLCDFGLSSIFLSEGATGLTTTTAHTGTERYLAPELVKSRDVCHPTRESDVYAMGCVGLKFILLIKPYANRQNNLQGHILRDILEGIPPATFEEAMDTPHQSLSITLSKSWDKTPSQRPTMPEFLSELSRINKDEKSNRDDEPLDSTSSIVSSEFHTPKSIIGEIDSPLHTPGSTIADINSLSGVWTYEGDNPGSHSHRSLDSAYLPRHSTDDSKLSKNKSNSLRASKSASSDDLIEYLRGRSRHPIVLAKGQISSSGKDEGKLVLPSVPLPSKYPQPKFEFGRFIISSTESKSELDPRMGINNGNSLLLSERTREHAASLALTSEFNPFHARDIVPPHLTAPTWEEFAQGPYHLRMRLSFDRSTTVSPVQDSEAPERRTSQKRERDNNVQFNTYLSVTIPGWGTVTRFDQGI